MIRRHNDNDVYLARLAELYGVEEGETAEETRQRINEAMAGSSSAPQPTVEESTNAAPASANQLEEWRAILDAALEP